MRLFLDDLRSLPDDNPDWMIARSFECAKDTIMGFWYAGVAPDHVSFDHDLGDGPTGADFAQWLIDTDLALDGSLLLEYFTFSVHSANPVGTANIRGKLDGYMKHKRGMN